jgi:MoxR-like ATPase
MKKYSNATAANLDAEEMAKIKSAVHELFQAGEVDIEIDDAEIRKEIANVEAKNNERHNRSSKAFENVLAGLKTLGEAHEALAKRLGNIDVSEAVRAEVEKASSFDAAKVRQIADALFQEVYAKAAAAEAKKGKDGKQPLPALKEVDTYFVENASCAAIQRAIDGGYHAMASGPSGAGKTYPIEQMLRKNGKRYIKVSIADGVTLSDFLCRQNVRVVDGGTETYYTYGFLVQAMKNDLPLLLDEIDQCQPEIVSVLNAVLETRELFIPQTGETVKAGRGFQVFMTCNTLRDSTGNYQGFRLNAALLNRVVFIKSDYLDAKDEISILERGGLAKNDARVIVGLFNGLRAAYNAGKLTQAPSTRIAWRIAMLLQGKNDEGSKCMTPMKLDEAFAFALFDGLPENEVKEALAVLKQGV